MSPKYGTVEYWDEQFDDKGEFEKPFDWLAAWSELDTEIIDLIPDKDSRVLIPGCGNAPFQLDMFDAGYHKMTCGDNSAVVVEKMEDLHTDRSIEWDEMDVTCMPYDDESFDAIIDKSLTDCLLCCEDAFRIMRCYLDEAFRVLVPGGVMVIISFSKESVIQASLRGRAWKLVKSQRIIKEADDTFEPHQDVEVLNDIKDCLMLYACVKQAPADAGFELGSGKNKSAKDRKKAEKAQRRMLQAAKDG